MTCLRLLKSLSLTLSYRPASCSSHFHFSFRLNKINNWVQRKGEALALWLSRFGGNSESLCKIPDGAVQGESEIFSADIILFCSCRSFAGHHGNLCTSYCTLFFFSSVLLFCSSISLSLESIGTLHRKITFSKQTGATFFLIGTLGFHMDLFLFSFFRQRGAFSHAQSCYQSVSSLMLSVTPQVEPLKHSIGRRCSIILSVQCSGIMPV
jgi:hypothetical protein